MPGLSSFLSNRLFDGADPATLAPLLEQLPVVHFECHDVIFKDGDPGGALYLVGSGAVRISKTGRGGQPEVLATFVSRDFFGEMALLDGQPRSASATAAAPCELIEVERPAFDRMLAASPLSLTRNIVASINSRLRMTNQHFIAELLRAERLSLLGSMANGIIHDLKNPLSTARFACEVLLDQTTGGDPAGIATAALNGIDEVFDMIQELLDFSRGVHRTETHILTTAMLLERIEPNVRAFADAHNVELDIQCSASRRVEIDERRISRSILNLARNGIEAMPGGGRLTILSKDGDQGRVEIVVSDTGIGIPPDLIPHLFEPFSTWGKPGGTGLGLAIVHAVVTAHQGNVTVQSEPGRGATMTISLPAIP